VVLDVFGELSSSDSNPLETRIHIHQLLAFSSVSLTTAVLFTEVILRCRGSPVSPDRTWNSKLLDSDLPNDHRGKSHAAWTSRNSQKNGKPNVINHDKPTILKIFNDFDRLHK
jgi:hypothetical protein